MIEIQESKSQEKDKIDNRSKQKAPGTRKRKEKKLAKNEIGLGRQRNWEIVLSKIVIQKQRKKIFNNLCLKT